MQTVKLPTLTCEEIEAHSRSFIWGSTNEKKKPHLVKWEQVCQPKVNGGLGIGRMSQNNEAFLMKLGWGIFTLPNALWVKVLRSKYMRKKVGVPQPVAKSSDSPLWKGIFKVWDY